MNNRSIFPKTLKTAVALTATSTAAVLLASAAETGKPFAALNAITHIVDGDDIEFPHEFAARETGIGLAVNATAMAAWALIYESALERAKRNAGIADGFAMSLAAYVVDYFLVPKRYTPGIERRLTKQAIFVIYAVLALTFASSRFWNNRTSPHEK
jgi:hypothetical protein